MRNILSNSEISFMQCLRQPSSSPKLYYFFCCCFQSHYRYHHCSSEYHLFSGSLMILHFTLVRFCIVLTSGYMLQTTSFFPLIFLYSHPLSRPNFLFFFASFSLFTLSHGCHIILALFRQFQDSV